MSEKRYRAAHRVALADGRVFEENDFLPEDLDEETIEQLKLAHSVYEYTPSSADEEVPPQNDDEE